ncbi:MAG: carboxymuconolactone decarboxylase family protein [Bacteroidota bacterium]
MEIRTEKKQTLRGFNLELQNDPTEEVQKVYDWSQETFGFIPNLTRLLSGSDATLLSYIHAQWHLDKIGSLSPAENNIVQLSIAVENECKYCTAGHTLAGKVFFGSAEEDLEALRNKTALSSEKFDALRSFAVTVYKSHGRVRDYELESFRNAGYNNAQALDVITNIAVKVISNFANQLAINEVDEPMQPFAEGLEYNESYR